MKLSEKELTSLRIGDIIKDKNDRYGYIYFVLYKDKYNDGHLGYVQVRWISDNKLPVETSECWSINGKNKWKNYYYVGHISKIGNAYEAATVQMPVV